MSVDGTALTVRPIEADDIDRLERMFGQLSRESVYYRFFAPIHTLPRSSLTYFAGVDHCRRDALVALDGDEIVAVARYDAMGDDDDAEIAVTVVDAWQHRGIGRRLTTQLRRTGARARRRRVRRGGAAGEPRGTAAVALHRARRERALHERHLRSALAPAEGRRAGLRPQANAFSFCV